MSDAIEIIPIRQPTIDNHVMFAHHDMPCPVCRSKHAVLNMNTGVFNPCWDCQSDGWKTEQKKSSVYGRVIRRIIRKDTE